MSFAGRSDDDVWVGATNGKLEYDKVQSEWSWDGRCFIERATSRRYGLGSPSLCTTNAAYWSVDRNSHRDVRRDGVVVLDAPPSYRIGCSPNDVWVVGMDNRVHRHLERSTAWPILEEGHGRTGHRPRKSSTSRRPWPLGGVDVAGLSRGLEEHSAVSSAPRFRQRTSVCEAFD